jgi:hypothetical protein
VEDVAPFAYWHGRDHSPIRPFVDEWRRTFPDTRVCGDADVLPLLSDLRPDAVELYQRIRYPAARSDVARLVLLHTLGGLYVDCGCGLRDPGRLRGFVRKLEHHELVLIDRSRDRFPRPAAERRPINSAVLARRWSPLVLDLLDGVLANLRGYDERAAGRPDEPVSVWYFTGAGAYREVLYRPGSGFTRHRPAYEGRIAYVAEQDAPIELWRHTGYRRSGAHWSKRQQQEPLLTPATSGG